MSCISNVFYYKEITKTRFTSFSQLDNLQREGKIKQDKKTGTFLIE